MKIERRLRPLFPRIRLRVGVSGHRGAPKLPPTAVPAVRASVDQVFSRIVDAAREAASELEMKFGKCAPREPSSIPESRADAAARFTVVSSLAEGADRIVAEAGLAASFDLETVLPFARTEYMRDFEAPDSRKAFEALLERTLAIFELDGDASERPRAYEAAGFVMLANIDLLIVIWDGKEASGIGGTAQIVGRAIADGIPVVWIDPARPSDLQLSSTLSGEVPLANVVPRDTFRTIKIDEIAGVVRDILNAPSQKEAAKSLANYLAEHERRWNFCPWYPLLLAVFTGRPPRRGDFQLGPALAGSRKEWQGYFNGLPDDKAQRPAIEAILLPAYAAADHLAIFYSYVYRGAYVFNFLFAGIAVTLALSGVFVHSPIVKSYAVFLELIVIAAILSTWLLGRERQWHRRWLEYRRLAESLRQIRILVPIGSTGPIDRPARGFRVDEQDWVNWYVWSVRRLLPLPNRAVDADYLASLRNVVRSAEIAGQIAYHSKNAQRIEMLDKWMHHCGKILFGLTGVICAFFVISVWMFKFPNNLHGHHILILITFFTALLPTVGAVLGAIQVQGDFKTVAEQSKRTAQRLEILDDVLSHEPAVLARLSDRIEKTSDVMMADLNEWQMVFRTRPLSLPA
jgi:hypothetical protein